MKIKFVMLTENAVTPTKAHPTDAGFDLTATSRHFDKHGAVVYGTGIAMEIPTGYVGLVFPRSSVSKFDLTMANCVGVIDAGYRGEITVKFKPAFRWDNKPASGKNIYKVGERCAQIIIMPIPEIEFLHVPFLSDGERGTHGYGSSGL